MSEMIGKGHEVSFSEFLNELEKEVSFFRNGGTTYRLRTAEIALDIAQSVKTVDLFLDFEIAKEIVSNLLPEHDHHRNDVAKMLYTIARDLEVNATLPIDVKEYVRQKCEKRMKTNERWR